LVHRGWLTLGYAILVSLFIEFKARREERWLLTAFPEYAEYRCRTRKFIPSLY